MKTYILEGGVGKHVAFTSLIKTLATRDRSPIQIYTPYVEVFANNPYVKLALESTSLPLDDARILESDDIVFVEPYKSTWQRGQEHVINAYARLLNIEYTGEKPELYTDHRKQEVAELKDKINKPFIVVQFNGGQSPTIYQGGDYHSNNPGKNYTPYLAQQLIHKLKKQFPDTEILNWSLPNEPQYDGAQPIDVHYTTMHELLKSAAGVIGADGCLMHLARSAGKTGVFVWGNTRINQFGYTQNTNLTFHGDKTYELTDPRNIMVDPDLIIEAFAKNHYKNTSLKSVLSAKLGNKKVSFKR